MRCLIKYLIFTVALIPLCLPSVATAQAIEPDGTVHFCVGNKDHETYINLAGNGSCSASQSHLDINKQGPQGPQGATGPQGPQGIPGQNASFSVTYGNATQIVITPGNSTAIVSCPQGQKV